MTYEEYKEKCKKYASYSKVNELEYLTLGLFNEIGELLGVEKKYTRGDFDSIVYREKIIGELGDIMWYVAMLENYFMHEEDWFGTFSRNKLQTMPKDFFPLTFIPPVIDVWDIRDKIVHDATEWYYLPIEAILKYNIDKLEDRYQRGVIKGSGDNR